jgi:hypothetical protein
VPIRGADQALRNTANLVDRIIIMVGGNIDGVEQMSKGPDLPDSPAVYL